MDRRRNSFTCYFCNKKIENQTEMGHTSVCGNVLIPCPNRCGSYIPRMELSLHRNECPNQTGRSMTRLPIKNDGLENYNTASLDRKLMGSYKDMFERLQQDVQKLSVRVSNYSANETQQDLGKVKYQSQVLLEWKKAVDFKLETLKQSINILEKFKTDKEAQWTAVQQKFMMLDQLQMDIDSSYDKFLKEQSYARQTNLGLGKSIDELRDLYVQENATLGALWNDQKYTLDAIQKDIDNIKQLLEEQKTKNTSMIFDIKTISQIASEAAEKLDIQERQFASFRKEFEQFKLDQDILENLVSTDSRAESVGHIIWKITDFDAKMSKSKESSTVLKSAIFYSHNFGYKIRVLAYLNGLKKWKDRYALLSLHVVKGDFDGLLKWPCYIEGSVTLRDQENLENPKIFSKHIAAKRQVADEENEEPQESSLSYIFIPHSTLTNSRFLKNDEIYLEIKIEHTRKLSTETTL